MRPTQGVAAFYRCAPSSLTSFRRNTVFIRFRTSFTIRNRKYGVVCSHTRRTLNYDYVQLRVKPVIFFNLGVVIIIKFGFYFISNFTVNTVKMYGSFSSFRIHAVSTATVKRMQICFEQCSNHVLLCFEAVRAAG